MIENIELLKKLQNQIIIWREYKDKVLEFQKKANTKKSEKDENENENKENSSDNSDDSDKKETDENENNCQSEEDEYDSSKNLSEDSSDSDSDSENENENESKTLNLFENDDNIPNISNDTIENESDLKNANYLKNEMKKKTNIGRKILKAIRLIYLRIMIKTHPDKVGTKFKKQFIEAKNANINQNIDELILLAIEVNSSLENLPIDINISVLLNAVIYKIEIFKKILNEDL